jgi:hypothetical protein
LAAKLHLHNIARQSDRSTYRLGPYLAAKIDMSDMLNFSTASLIGGFVFGSIGFVAFAYGKRMNLWKLMFCGLALMIYPYFVANTVAMIVIGVVGSLALPFLRD